MSCGFTALHAQLALARRLMRVLHAVIQITMLAMLDARQDRSLRRPIVFELIRDDQARHIGQPLEELAAELFPAAVSRRRCIKMSRK
jgi:hypothetical protein